MLRLVMAKRLRKELPRLHVSEVTHGALKAALIQIRRALLDTSQHVLLIFRQAIEIVHKIDQQKFPRELAWERVLDPKIKVAAPERERTVPLVIINDSLVIELRRSNAERVVGAGRS